ncbi:hypothetical protein MPDQ_000607 [Monascus purpureus]|uniref:Phosphoglycerate mutase n=1 Tax=Monascus purpureus TaxID=5098 RepID=A0A507QRC7_MONPU|nr:hypothetical protein MPDQ_000607 [Monascus purpureus]BDD63693.1 hypothetical protein MAP00_008559 [Monascus purpureus]
MGKPPAVIIIARYGPSRLLFLLVETDKLTFGTLLRVLRHGARLDAADKNWHLTSATPYDPPLTYGGWNQARALGARIISLLHAREDRLSANGASSDGRNSEPVSRSTTPSNGHRESHAASRPGSRSASRNRHTRRRKHQIIIHTSPYLRCLQTAIGVSAGINQHRLVRADSERHLAGKHHRMTDDAGGATPANNMTGYDDHRCLLRVDGFLGEWLTPDYFEYITPPPVSERMVATAKETLLRQGDEAVETPLTAGPPHPGHFPGGWGSSSHIRSSSRPVSSDTDDVGKPHNLATSPSSRHRAASFAGHMASIHPVHAPRHPRPPLAKLDTNFDSTGSRYSPPTPGYAVSLSDPIPPGNVSHARDACVEFDCEWDSMRGPMNWGDGGQYGEEWSAMHRRFRNGLGKMVDWYRTHDRPRKHNDYHPHYQYYSRLSHRRLSHGFEGGGDEDSGMDDDYTDTALVIITHGAGCNALIGALSSQPALIDIPTASLTMAVRKDIVESPSSPGGNSHPRSYLDMPIAHEYDLIVTASSDHLRPGVDPSKLPVAPASPKLPPRPPFPSYRRRLGTIASLSHGHFVMVGHSASAGGKPPTDRSPSPRTTSPGLWGAPPSPRISPGLWGSTSIGTGSSGASSEDLIVPNFADLQPTRSRDSEGGSSTSSNELWNRQLPWRTRAQRSLWGNASVDELSRRRWTMSDRR